MVLIVLSRHGETVWDHQHRLSGLSSVRLSDRGVSQAKVLARFLKGNYSFDRFYSSTLERAVRTAEIISKIIGLPFETVSSFNDIDCGECTGLTGEEVLEKYPEIVKGWKANTDPKFPNGENMQLLEKKVVPAFKKVLKREERVLIVSHASTNQAIIGWLLRIPYSYRFKIKQSHCCVNEVWCKTSSCVDFKILKINHSPWSFIKE